MNIFQQISANSNTINKSKISNGVDIEDPVNVSQLNDLSENKISIRDNSISYAVKPYFETDVTLTALASSLSTGINDIFASSLFSNTAIYGYKDSVKVLYNDELTEFPIAGKTLISVEALGQSIIAYSYKDTASQSTGNTVLYDMSTKQVVTVQNIDITKKHYIKYLKSINKTIFIRFDIAKAYLVDFSNNYSFVSSSVEINLPRIYTSPLVDANSTHIIISNFALLPLPLVAISTSALNVDSALTTTINNFLVNKKIYDIAYSGNRIMFSTSKSVGINDLIVYLGSNGTFTVFDGLSTELVIDPTITTFKIFPIVNDLVLISIKQTTSSTTVTSQYTFVDTSNYSILQNEANSNLSLLPFYDCLINSDRQLYDYSINEVNGNAISIKSASKQLRLGMSNLNPNDLISYSEMLKVLENVDFVINDNSFFLKTIADDLIRINGMNLYDDENEDEIILGVPITIENPTKFYSSWAKITTSSNAEYFIPVEIRLINDQEISVYDVNRSVFRKKDIKTIEIASNIADSVLTTSYDIPVQTSGSHILVMASSVDQSEINNIAAIYDLSVDTDFTFVDINNYQDIALDKNASMLIVSSTEDLDTTNLNLFTNAGSNIAGSVSTKSNSGKIFLFASGNPSTNVNSTSTNPNIMFMENGVDQTNMPIQIYAAFIGACKIATIMNKIGCSFYDAVNAAVNTSTTNPETSTVGYGSINTEEAIQRLLSSKKFVSEANANIVSKTISSEQIQKNSHVPKSMIFGVANDSMMFTLYASPLKTTELTTNTFILGKKYVVTNIGSDADFSNIGFIEHNVAFFATGTSAKTFNPATSTVFEVDSVVEISNFSNFDIGLISSMKEYPFGNYPFDDYKVSLELTPRVKNVSAIGGTASKRIRILDPLYPLISVTTIISIDYNSDAIVIVNKNDIEKLAFPYYGAT